MQAFLVRIGLWLLTKAKPVKAFGFRLFDALSQVLNVLCYWKHGTANCSVSGDAYKFKRYNTQNAIDLAFYIYEDEHCKKSYMNDVARAYALIEEYERERVEQA